MAVVLAVLAIGFRYSASTIRTGEINIKKWPKESLVSIYGGMLRLLGIDYADVSGIRIVRMADGQMAFLNDRKEMAPRIESVAALGQWLSPKGIDVLYVQLPAKVDKFGDATLPYGLTDYANENADAMLSGLREHGIKTVDIRDSLHAAFTNYASLFFVTDHHWTFETGFFAYAELARELQASYPYVGGDVGFFADRNNYDFAFETDAKFLGKNLGGRLGQWYAGYDTLRVLMPRYDDATEYTVTTVLPDRERITQHGRFSATLLPVPLHDARGRIHYGIYGMPHAYVSAELVRTTVVNHRLSHGKALLLCDSFAGIVLSLLANHFGVIDAVDLRSYNKEYGKVCDLIETEGYDLVILMFSPGLFFEDAPFDYFNNVAQVSRPVAKNMLCTGRETCATLNQDGE
ncbi:MAG: hypothetical protein FWF84_00605 [Kiritimatiellaeota bacterium]|nr:hypothetical protein [Kiritimatiellota bacterium]